MTKNYFVCFLLILQVGLAKGQSINFNKDVSETLYNHLPQNVRWAILSSIAKEKFVVQNDVDSWLNEKLQNYPDLIVNIPALEIRDLLYKLWRSNNFESFYYLKEQVLQNLKHDKRLFYAAGIAAFGKLNYLTATIETENAEFYFNLMRRGMLLDSDNFLVFRYFHEKANVAYHNGNLVSAISYYFKTLENCSLNDNFVRNIFHNLAICYSALGNLEKAESYTISELIFPYPKKPSTEALMSLGILFNDQNRIQEAQRIFQEVRRFAIAQKDSILLGRTYFNLQVVEDKEKQYDVALLYLDSAETIFTNINLTYGIFMTELYRARVFANMRDFKTAERLSVPLEINFEQFNSPRLMKNYYSLMYEVYDSLGNQNQANKYFRLHHDKDEKLIGRQNLMAINELELEKQKSAEDRKKSILKADLERQKHQNELLILFFFIFLLIVISIFIIIRKRNQINRHRILFENREIRHSLELKSRELLADSVKNLSLENLKEQIYTDLNAVIENLPKSQQELFHGINNTLNRKNKDTLVDEFEERFIGVHEDFYVNLRTHAPDLSAAEIKLCAFIRLNLSTKEIAYLTNRTIGTIDNARSKIRRKLELSEDDNLFTFLSQL